MRTVGGGNKGGKGSDVYRVKKKNVVISSSIHTHNMSAGGKECCACF